MPPQDSNPPFSNNWFCWAKAVNMRTDTKGSKYIYPEYPPTPFPRSSKGQSQQVRTNKRTDRSKTNRSCGTDMDGQTGFKIISCNKSIE